MKELFRNASFLLLFWALMLPAGDTLQPQREELNPDFVAFRTQLELFRQGLSLVPPPALYGYIPAPVSTPGAMPANLQMPVFQSFPARFDLRQHDKVSPVRDQGSCGSCWAFGTMSSLQSSLLPADNKVFSPEHLIVAHGFDYDPCEGGNEFMSLAYFSRWGGPINEDDLPYIQGYASAEPYQELIDRHVQEIVFLPRRSGFTDNDHIKHLLTRHGAVVFSYHADNAYLQSSTASYYCYESKDINHMVVIIGWDDDYPAGNFRTAPPGNGAFIAKNSWGSNWGQQGFFYISYYDQTAGNFVSFNNAEGLNNYGYNYYHDPLGWCTTYGYGNPVAWAANVFEARNNQPIEAVSFILPDVRSQALIRVYRNVTPGNPAQGELVSEQMISRNYPGLYTVKLDQPVSLSRGQLFSVVIRVQNGGSGLYPIAVEAPFTDYSSQATSRAGESYISSDGLNWTDFIDESANNCIKAFSRKVIPDLRVSVREQRIDAWMVSRKVALVSVNVANYNQLDLGRIVVYRKTRSETAYEPWWEFSAAAGNNGLYECIDAFLEKNRQYSYKVVLLDSHGTVLANSGNLEPR